MADASLPQRRSIACARARDVAEILALALAVLFCGAFFVGLDRSSLWLDELFTSLVLLTPRDLHQAIVLVARDVHPPLYYALLWGWTEIAGFSPGKIRLFSALCASAAVAVLYLGTAPLLSRWGRAFLAALAASSLIMFNYAQDARMYALLFLFEAVLIACILRSQAAYAERRTDWLALSGAAIATFLASLTHFYGFLVSGLALLWLLIFARSWRARGFVVAVGLAILAVEIPLALRMASNARTAALWFRGDLHWVWWNTRDFLISVFNRGNTLALLATAAAGAWAVRGARRARAPLAEPPRVWPVLLAMLVVGGALLIGVLVNTFVVPSFSTRNLHVTAPFIWLAAACAAEAATASMPQGRGDVAALVLTLCLAPALGFLGWKTQELRTPWRESAAFVTSLPGCATARLTVVGQPEANPGRPIARFAYGFYAPRATFNVMTPDELNRVPVGQLQQKLAAAAAPGACPVVLWSAHYLEAPALQLVLDRLAPAPDWRLTVRSFRNLSVLLDGAPIENTYVVVLRPQAGRP